MAKLTLGKGARQAKPAQVIHPPQIQYVEVIKEVPVEVVREVIKEVKVPVEVLKETTKEVRVEVPVEKVIEIIVEKPVIQEKLVEKLVTETKIEYLDRIVPRYKIPVWCYVIMALEGLLLIITNI